MIASFSTQTSLRKYVSTRGGPSGLSRVFAAAVVNRQFCDMLLQDPSIALQRGYLGEVFSLSNEEKELIVSIRASSLADFARQATAYYHDN